MKFVLNQSVITDKLNFVVDRQQFYAWLTPIKFIQILNWAWGQIKSW